MNTINKVYSYVLIYDCHILLDITIFMELTAQKQATGKKGAATALELGTYALSRSLSHASHGVYQLTNTHCILLDMYIFYVSDRRIFYSHHISHRYLWLAWAGSYVWFRCYNVPRWPTVATCNPLLGPTMDLFSTLKQIHRNLKGINSCPAHYLTTRYATFQKGEMSNISWKLLHMIVCSLLFCHLETSLNDQATAY